MAKKKWQVIKNTTSPHVIGVDVGDEKFSFQRNGTFVVEDAGLARDIDKVYGRKGNQQVVVVPHNDPETRELGHTYHFTGVDTSHFKVWVMRNGKIARVTKAVAQKKGYPIVSTRKRPELTEVQNAR